MATADPSVPTCQSTVENQPRKIGLALSGGGFRASIFHLGVIRRLEELGIMKEVDVISAVSGGSIIAAYYVVEMEQRLRIWRDDPTFKPQELDSKRLEFHQEIAGSFFDALDNNLRVRALVFSPLYHPLLWIRSLWPGYSRSDLLQKEYDRWLYHNNSVDELPATIPEDNPPRERFIYGPKLIMNTTSLLSGKLVPYFRLPVTSDRQMGQVHENALRLSQVVGASSCVPVVFPPVKIAGDTLVDGGVADNQGVMSLMKEECNVLIVSDASGQIDVKNSVPEKALSVALRSSLVQQHHLRQRILNLLISWKFGGEGDLEILGKLASNWYKQYKSGTVPANILDKGIFTFPNGREFAFIQMFQNLKDRDPLVSRVPSEYIGPLAGIRTDLDQFSMVERETLMYHGYTLISSQIREYCPNLLKQLNVRDELFNKGHLWTPPLFQEGGFSDEPEQKLGKIIALRRRIRRELEIGASTSYLLRCLKKYGVLSGLVLALFLILPFLIGFISIFISPKFDSWTLPLQGMIRERVDCVIPGWIRWIMEHGADYIHWPITSKGIVAIATLFIWVYFWGWFTYLALRPLVAIRDRIRYGWMTKKPLVRKKIKTKYFKRMVVQGQYGWEDES